METVSQLVLSLFPGADLLGLAFEQLGRIRGLIMQALAGLGEPTRETMNVTQMFLDAADSDAAKADYDRFVRDAAAAILHSALTWGIGDEL